MEKEYLLQINMYLKGNFLMVLRNSDMRRTNKGCIMGECKMDFEMVKGSLSGIVVRDTKECGKKA